MKKYGLQIRGPPAVASAKKPLPLAKKPSIFNEDDDEEDTVEQAIARQAAKNRALKEVELQHKAALEQDSTVFDYDGVYDDMKAKSAPPIKEDPELKKPKYITKLLDKAKTRQQEQEVIYERKLLKEREREDHLYGDKEKYVTTAYKQKLAEQAKWLEEERLRELREQAEEVTKRSDLSDFYRNLLSKNEAFGASKHKAERAAPQESLQAEQEKPAEGSQSRNSDLGKSSEQDSPVLVAPSDRAGARLGVNDGDDKERLHRPETKSSSVVVPEPDPGNGLDSSIQREMVMVEQKKSGQTERKPSEDVLSAAKERYLARKRLRTT